MHTNRADGQVKVLQCDTDKDGPTSTNIGVRIVLEH